jgi:membrane peptidoglycan carboxypeptidase
VPPTAGRAGLGAAVGRASVGGAVGRASVGATMGRASASQVSAQPTGQAEQPATQAGNPDGKKGAGPKRRWRNLVLAAMAAFILLAGAGVIAGTYFYDTVPEPADFSTAQNTFVYSADGQQIAKLGGENRIIIAMGTLSDEVKKALIAGEDKNFFDHSGIDLWGIARAAWNNLTGGETQGASTITQQYARNAAKDLGVTYARKLREAVMAQRLEQKYNKEEILGFYVNTVWYGRSSIGVGAASQAYFGKPADKLTVAEAAVLGAVLKQPEPVEGGAPGFDPHYNLAVAKQRWGYVLNNMVEMGWLDKTKRATMAYPEKSLKKYRPGQYAGETGIQGTGTGLVIQKYIDREMNTWGLTDWRDAGYKITTTINKKAQDALEDQLYREFVWRKVCKNRKKPNDCDEVLKGVNDRKGSVLYGQPKNLVAAGVAIDPRTGEVLAYYGGTDGTGIDYAGKNAEGTIWEDGGHPAASSFKVYTLTAAIRNGISIKSKWNPTDLTKKKDGVDLNNANRDVGQTGCDTNCPLRRMLELSYNVPFYKVAKKIGPPKIVETLRDLGITTMWPTGDGKARDLNDPGIIKGERDPFDYQIGFGQYKITVLDHATGLATLANHGVYNKPHFIKQVERRNEQTGQWESIPGTGAVLRPERRIEAQYADEVTGVLKGQPARYGHPLADGRVAAAKTGTWENGQVKADGRTLKYPRQNAHVWTVGYTPQIAAAIWVGNVKDELPLKLKNGYKITSVGLPADIWRRFMNAAHRDLKLPKEPLADCSCGLIGDAKVGDGVRPSPTPTPGPVVPLPPSACLPGLTCPTPAANVNPIPVPRPSASPSPTPTGAGAG